MTVNADITALEPEVQEAANPYRLPLVPSKDPFYQPPEGFGALTKGTILRSRSVEIGAFGRIGQRKISAWQLLYVSSDLHGAPDAAVTTVLLPEGAAPDRPLIAYQAAVDAVADFCFPSYALQRGARGWTSNPQFEYLLIVNLLKRGYAVSVADHEGLTGRFAAPREPGYRGLDGVRAALNFEPLGLQPSTRIAIWGYSGGGMAAAWMAEMAETYAPELDIVGAALGAPVGDPGKVFVRLNGKSFAGLPLVVLAGLRHTYPTMAKIIDERGSFALRRRLRLMERMCTNEFVIRSFRHNIERVLDGSTVADLVLEDDVVEMFDDLRLGKNSPPFPLLVVQAVSDQIIHSDIVDTQVDRYRAGGSHVRYRRDRLSEHITLAFLSAPAALRWIDDRLADRPLPADDTETVWSVAAADGAWRHVGPLAWSALKAIVGRPI